MKATVQQISKYFSAKAGLDVQVNTFDELKSLLEDLVPVIRFSDDGKNDCNTSSLDSMIDGYYSESYTPEIRITAKKEIIGKLMTIIKSDRCDFDDVDDLYTNYDYFENVPDGATTNWCILDYDKMSDVFEKIRIFSKEEQIDLPVRLVNISPENEWEKNNNTIEFCFSKGTITGGGSIFVVDDATSLYPMRLYWLCYAFAGMTMDEVSALGIEIEHRPFEGEILEPRDCGVLLGINYKYGKTPHLFDDLNTTLELIKKYPILINYLPQELKQNKETVLTFISANNAFVKKYYDAMDDSITETTITCSALVRLRMADAYRNGCPDGMPNGIINPFFNDVDVLVAVSNSFMWDDFYLSAKTYNEKIAGEVASKAPQFARTLFEYWEEEICQQPKIANAVCIKHELRSDIPRKIITLYKCMDILNSSKFDCRNALGRIMADVSSHYWGEKNKECHKELALIFRKMDIDLQNDLADMYYPLVAFIRADDLDEELAEEVAENCPIAASLLPDSYILKHNLQVLDVGEDEYICGKCGACFFRNIRFV